MTPRPGGGDDDLMTGAQVARLFNVDPKTVTRWAQAGLIPVATRTLGGATRGHRRYRRADVMALYRQGAQGDPVDEP